MGKNSKYFTAQELMERWQVNAIDLCMLFPKICPTSYSTITGGKYDTKGFVPTTAQLNKTHFPKAAVLEYETQHPELKPQDAAPYVSSKGEIPPYLDKEHPHYSTELATSIEIWMQLFQSDAPIENKRYTIIEQIKAALRKKGLTGKRETGRLAAGINPNHNKRGGGTRTKKKATSKRTVSK